MLPQAVFFFNYFIFYFYCLFKKVGAVVAFLPRSTLFNLNIQTPYHIYPLNKSIFLPVQ